jgi:RNA recognition motif-containing protein
MAAAAATANKEKKNKPGRQAGKPLKQAKPDKHTTTKEPIKGSSKATKKLKQPPEQQTNKPTPELTDTIFIRNVSIFDTTQESLKKHMEENFGPTVYCLICKDKETGESKGTAFVKFKEPETAAKCLEEFKDRELQTKFFLDGRNLFVLPALTRDQAVEVKQASAKKDQNVIKKKKKFKKARHHRVPASKR